MIAAGAGGAFNDEQRKEWESVGVKASQRARRLVEMAQIVKGLTRGETVSFHGRHFDLDSTVMLPKSPQPGGVPLLLACHGRSQVRERQIRRAARWGDGVVSISDTPAEYEAMVGDFRAAASELGRESGSLEATMYLTVNVDPDRVKAAAEGGTVVAGLLRRKYLGAAGGGLSATLPRCGNASRNMPEPGRRPLSSGSRLMNRNGSLTLSWSRSPRRSSEPRRSSSRSGPFQVLQGLKDKTDSTWRFA